jgi:hypothetical protein
MQSYSGSISFEVKNMVLKLEFTDGHEPWISFPMNREEALKLWNSLSKMPTVRPEFRFGKLKCRCDCLGNWYVAQWFDGMHKSKTFRYLANALKYMEKRNGLMNRL